MRATSAAVMLWLIALSAGAQEVEGPPTGAPATSEALPPQAPAEPTPASASGPGSGGSAPGAEPGSEALSDVELKELGFEAARPAVDTSVHFSGFIDFGSSLSLDAARRGSTITGNHPAFYIGNLNLYISKSMTESVRTMAEIRFLYLPNGASDNLVLGEMTRTATPDYSDYNRSLNWGGVEIERVYFEWAAHRFLTIRAGQFLTPYGIWNVDHGSPTIITVGRPFVIGAGWFPERQTGLELHGRAWLGSDNAVGYHLTLSNGAGPVTEYKDLDRNKAVGGRVYWEYRRLGEFRLGGSGYYGRDTDSEQTFTLPMGGGSMPMMGAAPEQKILEQYDSLSFAVDAQWKYRELYLQGEWIGRQQNYTPEGRIGSVDPMNQAVTYPIDNFGWGYYLLAGWRFNWLGVMPYLVHQGLDQVDPNFGKTRFNVYQAGLNVRPIPSTVLKIEYALVKNQMQGNLQLLNLQLAWAF